MYIPAAFREDDLPTLHTLMQDYNFAVLVMQHDGVPLASHLPFMLDPQAGERGTLHVHLARGNPQVAHLAAAEAGAAEVLVIFQGPHAYISPSWYEADLSVPTWNFAAVHAYGIPCLFTQPAVLEPMLRDLVQQHEAAFDDLWPMALPDDYLHKQMRGVVGVELPITRLEGKFKLSQNRSACDQAQVAAALHAGADPLGAATAQLMDARCPPE